MDERSMLSLQESGDSGWRLAPGEACSWQAPRACLLEVAEGRLWIAHTGRAGRAAADVVLREGETLRLQAGDRLVMEGWPQARFEFRLVRERRPQSRGARLAGAWSQAFAALLPGRQATPHGC